MIEIKRKDRESANAFLYRFTKKIQQSGVLKESKKKRFFSRSKNKHTLKESALYRDGRQKEVARMKKLGK